MTLLLALTILQWAAIGLLIYAVVAVPFVLLLGRSVRHGTGDLPEPADWLHAEDMWDWPNDRKDAA